MEKRPVILAVDDDEPILKLLRTNLPLEGYDVVTASDSKSALGLLEECDPGLVILDIMMPNLDGFQVLTLIRKRSNVPVIVLSAIREVTAVRDTLALGADDYVTKPLNIQVLSARIQAKLRRQGKKSYE